MLINDRIAALRNSMKLHGYDAYIVPSNDPHNSEYVAERWKSREWISGFTGSAGTVAITHDHAGLWTDSRYFLQADAELQASEMQLHKMFNQFKPQYAEWLAEHLKEGAVVALDGELFSKGLVNMFEKIFKQKSITIDIKKDLFQEIWLDRDPIPNQMIFEHNPMFAGKSRSEKLNKIRSEMVSVDADIHLITTLDDIAWSFNIRGNDVEYNPVAIAYAAIEKDRSILFIDDNKVPNDLKQKLVTDNIQLLPYDGILNYLNNLNENSSVLIDKRNCNIALFRAINSKNIIEESSIPRRLKAIKNETEIEHTRNVMVKDGVALSKAFFWLENTLDDRTVSEIEFSDKLAEFRSQQEHYRGESFGAIIGYQDNGAVIHYRPNIESSKNIKKEGMLLCDSGGQYLDGTTDITRTVTLSSPSAEHKKNFTLVLKGMIALTLARFPKGTKGGQLDTLARQFLWENGLNYLHGTGHGVGFFLNVHEPTQGFSSPGNERGDTVHVPGMISSNEPGYYKDGAYGIRIENLIVCQEDPDGFLSFETLTLMPIDLDLVDMDIMSQKEKDWLNDYHELVNEKLRPHLNENEAIWLDNKTRSI